MLFYIQLSETNGDWADGSNLLWQIVRNCRKNNQKGWNIRYDNQEFSGTGKFLTDINCYGFGCGWNPDDWKMVNQEMEKAAALVKGMIQKE